MRRLSLALLVVTASSGMALAETKDERLARCEQQAMIVQSAVEARQDGKREKRAIRQIKRARRDMDTPYEEVVSPLVGWVFSLTEDEMQNDVADSFSKACKGYKS